MDGKEYTEFVSEIAAKTLWVKDTLKQIGEIILNQESTHNVKLFNWKYPKDAFFCIQGIDFGFAYIFVHTSYTDYGPELAEIPVTWLLDPLSVLDHFQPEIDTQINHKLKEQEKKAQKARAKEEKERKLLAELKAKYE